MDRTWAEHQAWERQRRLPPTPEEIAWRARQEELKRQRRAQTWAQVLRARDAVMADFARWERERQLRQND